MEKKIRKRYHSEEAVKKAREILLSAEKQVEDYKVKKEKEIVKLSLEMAKIITNKNFENESKRLSDAIEELEQTLSKQQKEKLDEIKEIQQQINQKYTGIHATLNVVYLDITVDCTKGTGLQKLCSLFKEDVTFFV